MKYIKQISLWMLKIVLFLLSFTIIGYVLLSVSFILPDRPIVDHVKTSYESFVYENIAPQSFYGYSNSILDNYTDALMLSESVNYSNLPFYKASLSNDRFVLKKGDYPVENLVDYADSGQNLENTSYYRYWHGYLVILRPLLEIFNYIQIRYLLMFVFMLSVTYLLYLLVKNKLTLLIIPFLAFLFAMNPISVSRSLQYSSCFYLAILPCIAMLQFKKYFKAHRASLVWLFLAIGALTSFFDLLTSPLITFGIPFSFSIIIFRKQHKIPIMSLISRGLVWAIGYIGAWAGKWLIGSIVLHKNIFSDAITQLTFRTSNTLKGANITYFDVLEHNFSSFGDIVAILLLILLLAYIIYLIKMRKTYHMIPKKELIANIITLVVVALIPFIWYAVTTNHSYIHSWMTYRNLCLSIFALFCLPSLLIEKERL